MQILRKMVYVVDDDDAVRDSVEALLEAAGMQVEKFDSAGRFLRYVQFLPCKCVLLDIGLPDMDGFRVLEFLAKMDINLPVVMITGHADLARRARKFHGDIVAVVEKPVRDATLFAALQKAFHQESRIEVPNYAKPS